MTEAEIIRSSFPRYGRTPRALLRDPEVSSRAKVLYALLDDYAGREGKAFPSRATIADALGCSVDSVDRAVKELERHGWISRELRFRDQRRAYDSTLYTLQAPPVETVEEPVDKGGRTRAASRTRAEGVAAPVPTEGEPREGTTPHSPPRGGRARRDIPDDDPSWAAFWTAYPRKQGKAAARRSWVKALDKPDTSPERLVDAARRYAGTVTETRYACNPSTWLNQERWLDDTALPSNPTTRRNVRDRSEECPIHAGEHRAACRGCAADAKAAG